MIESEYYPWRFVQAASVVALHAAAIERYGGTHSPATGGCVERSIGAAITAAMYIDEETPDLLAAVAHLLVYLAKNHCFTDGNKRVAWAALVHTLRLNGLRVVGDEVEATQLVEGIAAGTSTVHDVIAWLGGGRIEAEG